MNPIFGMLFGILLLLIAALSILLLRQRRGAAPASRATRLDDLAGFGQAILTAQLKLDALCEVVYQQVSQIINTSNFQLGLFHDDDYTIMIWIRNNERLPEQRFPRAASEGLIGWVRQSGQDLLIRDYQQEWEDLPAKPRYLAQHPARSGLFAPLVAGGVSIGVIAIQSDTPNAYDADDLSLLTILTNQAAGAIHNAQLFEAAQARNRQLQLVSQVSEQVTTIQPLPTLFEQIVTLLQQTFDYYAVNIFTLDERDHVLTLQASTHDLLRSQIPVLAEDEGLVGWSASHARVAWAADVTRDDRYHDDGVLAETRAEVAVPLVVERRVMGVLDVQSNAVNAFGQDDLAVLETLARQIALAIQEAETYTAERRQRERLHALAEASRAVVSILHLDDLLEEVIDLLTDYFGYDRTHIFLLEGDQIIFRAGSGIHSGRWTIEHLAYALDGPGVIARCVRTGQPVVVGDVRQNSDYIPSPGVEDTQAEMVLPIRIGRQILGALDIQSKQLNAFSSDDTALGEALADTIAIALRNATLYAREKRRRILAESLREVSMVLGASLEVDHVLNGILQGLQRVITIDSAMIVLHDDDNSYQISAVCGQLDENTLLGTLLPGDTDIPTALTAYFHPDDEQEQHNHHAHRFIPLSMGDVALGYLAIDYHYGRFSQDDEDILNAFAMQSAIAIANAQLYMAQREEAWISTALLQVAEATAHTSSLDEVLRTVARITPLLIGVEWCAVLLREATGYRVVEIEGTDAALEQVLVGHVIRETRWEPLDRLTETGQPVILDQQPLRFPSDAPATALTPPVIQQGIMLPLFAKGELVGALLIGQQDEEATFSTRKIEMITGIANQAALAIESAQLYAAQQEEAWITAALLQVAEAVNAQVDLHATLTTITRLTTLLTGVQVCVIWHWDEDHGCFSEAVVFGLPQSAEALLTQTTIVPEQTPYFAALRTTTTPLYAGENTPYPLPPLLQVSIPQSNVLGLPLTAHGKQVGLMLVAHPPQEARLDDRRLNMLTGIASQTALAIETSQLQATAAERQQLERELAVAQSIQTSFLPDSAPAIPCWDLAAYYRAARMVGGDFYDFMPLPDGQWGLVVADVADKGIPAALYMALSRTVLRAVARNRDNPADTLLRVNKLLLEDTHSDLFVTMWYAILNPADGTLFYASAGHNPPFIVSQNGQPPRTLKVKGIALGVLPDITLETATTTLQPGDTLVMYTDGITEAQNAAKDQFGTDRLEQTAHEQVNQSAERLIQAITERLDAHTGDEPQFDDLTLVVVRRVHDDETVN